MNKSTETINNYNIYMKGKNGTQRSSERLRIKTINKKC